MNNYEIAFQGEHYAFSELAARKFLGESTVCYPHESFEQVFQTVRRKENILGIIPIENTLSGSIHQNYDLLLDNDVKIVGEVRLRIELNLIAMQGVKFADIKKVYSHPAALGQCRDFWARHRDVKIIPSYDTAGSVKLIAKEKAKDAGAVASRQAAEDYKMNIIFKDIEDFKDNYTRFLIISNHNVNFGPADKTSIVFTAGHKPGALFKSLSVFFLRDINLLKIESRPLRWKPWQYLFYLDLEGDMNDQQTKNAMRHLEEITEFIKVLGSYPAAKDEKTETPNVKG